MAVMYIWSTGEHFRATTPFPDALMGSEDVQNMLQVAYALCSVFCCPVATVVVRVRYGQVFATCIFLVLHIARKHGLVQAWVLSGPRFPDFQLACATGGGGRLCGCESFVGSSDGAKREHLKSDKHKQWENAKKYGRDPASEHQHRQ